MLWETNDAKGGMRFTFPPYGLDLPRTTLWRKMKKYGLAKTGA